MLQDRALLGSIAKECEALHVWILEALPFGFIQCVFPCSGTVRVAHLPRVNSWQPSGACTTCDLFQCRFPHRRPQQIAVVACGP